MLQMNEEHPYIFPWCFTKCKHFISKIKNVVIKQQQQKKLKKETPNPLTHIGKKKQATEMLLRIK